MTQPRSLEDNSWNMSSSSNTPPDGYFNDLSRPTGDNGRNKRARSPTSEANGIADGAEGGGDSSIPKPKRIACIICRKRKLKCDSRKPACSTCTRLGHDCAYDEVRRKSGPKRGYVKALEERLKQVETLLKTQDPSATTPETSQTTFPGNNPHTAGLRQVPATDFTINNATLGITGVDTERWGFNGESPQPPMDGINFPGDINMGIPIDDSTFTWEMIGLGLEEPLPPQDTIDELHQIYFDKIHPSLPMMHKFRYLAAMNLAPNQRPPVALRYAMWTHAASVTERFMDLKDHFYQRARKYVEVDYMKGHGEHMISIAHAQTHILLASYEFKMMYFPRAWMSTGSGIRLCQMMSLHKLDGAGLDVKQTLPNPRDWTEREERRRTFWMAFCEDRYASIGTGWPMSIDERDILTDLPASDEAFDMSKPERTLSLTEAISPLGASKLSSFAGVILMASLFGRNLIHLHRPDPDDRDDDLNGEFWKRHRNMDNILLNTSLSMPSHLKLPNGLSNANIVFTNMNIHTSTICLHQAAIYKAEKNNLPASISAESKVRCITAANEIASVMRMISHMDLSTMNPFISFCLYVAARVFVQYLKSRPEDSQTGDSLRFLLSAMNALKKKNPLTESFLVQLDVDLEGLGMQNPKFKTLFAYSEDNLGISSAKMRNLGGAPRRPGENQECNFLVRIAEDTPHVDSRSPAAAKTDLSNIDFSPPADTSAQQQQQQQQQQGSWASSDRQDMQRTLQGLAISSSYSSDNLHANGFGNDGSNSGDTGLSPDTASNRLTPNSTTPSESQHTRSSLQPGQAHSQSHTASYEASPSSATHQRVPPSDTRTIAAFFAGQTEYNGITTTGMTPEASVSLSGQSLGTGYVLPETPGRGFEVPSDWGMGNANEMGGSGMTPVGEGVFRHLMGLGNMDPMDIGWEGNS